MTEEKIETITEIQEGDDLFISSGESIVKVVKDNVTRLFRIPVTTKGLSEFQDKLRREAPKPPKKDVVVKRGSEEAIANGWQHDTTIISYDTTDEGYLEAMENHTNDFLWKSVIFASDLKLKKADGMLAETYEQKTEILKSAGFTDEHMRKVFSDIAALTSQEEE